MVTGHKVFTAMYDDNLSEILGASSRFAPTLDLDLAFDTVDSNVDPAYIPLLCHFHPFPLPSPPPLLLLLLENPSEIQEFSLSNLKNTRVLGLVSTVCV